MTETPPIDAPVEATEAAASVENTDVESSDTSPTTDNSEAEVNTNENSEEANNTQEESAVSGQEIPVEVVENSSGSDDAKEEAPAQDEATESAKEEATESAKEEAPAQDEATESAKEEATEGAKEEAPAQEETTEEQVASEPQTEEKKTDEAETVPTNDEAVTVAPPEQEVDNNTQEKVEEPPIVSEESGEANVEEEKKDSQEDSEEAEQAQLESEEQIEASSQNDDNQEEKQEEESDAPVTTEETSNQEETGEDVVLDAEEETVSANVEEENGSALSDEDMDEYVETGPTIESLMAEAEDNRQQLLEENKELERKLVLVMNQRKTSNDRNQTRGLPDGQDARYNQALLNWMDELEKCEQQKQYYNSLIYDISVKYEEKRNRAYEIRDGYIGFKMEIAKSAENSRTGKLIPNKVLAEIEELELVKEEEVERVRLKNIQLRNQMKKLELSIKQKEELAEGLHLIDFEQLKIENQSLHEKIDERNEELLKLRKKTTTTVQVLTHIKEKLQFVQKENKGLEERLNILESNLSQKRDLLQKAKQDRDKLRLDNSRLKGQSAYITNATLIEDMQSQFDRKDGLLHDIQKLQRQHTSLSQKLEDAQSALQATNNSPVSTR